MNIRIELFKNNYNVVAITSRRPYWMTCIIYAENKGQLPPILYCGVCSFVCVFTVYICSQNRILSRFNWRTMIYATCELGQNYAGC